MQRVLSQPWNNYQKDNREMNKTSLWSSVNDFLFNLYKGSAQ